MAENKKPTAGAIEQNDAREPTTTAVASSPRFGRGILIGATAAALVIGVALGGTGGFALANANVHDRAPGAAEQGGMQGGHPQQGPRDARPWQGGPGGGQNGPQGQPGNGGAGNHQPGQTQNQNDNIQQDDAPQGDTNEG